MYEPIDIVELLKKSIDDHFRESAVYMEQYLWEGESTDESEVEPDGH